ncbi:MAG: hypothetical protein AB8C13_10230 [Phycisphaerales bacterium]
MQQLKSIFISTLLFSLVLALTACGSTRYAGKVIPGTVGRPIIVSTTDDRINNNPGVEGLTVTIYNEPQGGQPPIQITRTTTDEEGEFVFSIPSAQTPRGAVVIRVTGDDIYSARSKAFLPRNGQLMLFSVVSRNPFPDSATASQESTDE